MKWITLVTLFAVFFSQSQNTPSQLDVVDFEKAKVDLTLDQNSTEIKGNVTYQVKILKDTPSIFLNAKNLVNYKATINGKEGRVIYDGETVTIQHPFKAGTLEQINISFTSYPSKALYHIDQDNDGQWDQIWTQGQGKYTSNWLPSIDDMNDKMIWSFIVSAPQLKQVIANGKLTEISPISNQKVWKYEMENPMSSYLVALAVGDYEVKKRLAYQVCH